MEKTNRREFFKKALWFGGAGVVAAGTRSCVKDVFSGVQEGKDDAETRFQGDFEASEKADNWMNSYSSVYFLNGKRDGAEIVFIDQNGNIIEGIISTDDYFEERFHDGEKVTVLVTHTDDGERIEDVIKEESSKKHRDKTIKIDAYKKKNQNKLDQKWLNLWREYLNDKYPSIHLDLEKDEEKPYQVNTIGQLDGSGFENYYDLVMSFGKKDVMNLGERKVSRIKYVKEIFSKSTKLPTGIKERLADISYGIAGVESNFDNSKRSYSGAQGIWQIMPNTLKRLGYKRRDITSLKKTTQAARKQFERIYQTLVENLDSELKSIKDKYNLSQDELENNFIFPCMVDSYHAGDGRVRKMISWFDKKYSRDKLEKEIGTYDKYGDDLYVEMSRLCLENKAVRGYGKKSMQYFLKTNGLASLIRDRYFEGNEQEDGSEYEPPYSEETSEFTNQLLVGGAAGVIAVGVRELIKNNITMQEFTSNQYDKVLGKVESFVDSTKIMGQKVSRRKAIIGASVAGGAGLISVLLSKFFKAEKESSNRKNKLDWDAWDGIALDWSMKESLNNLAKDEFFTKFPDGYKHGKVPRRIQGKLITPWMKRNNIYRFKNLKDIQNSKKLVKLDEYASTYYRCRKVGYRALDSKDKHGYENHDDYLSVMPSTKKMVGKISKLVNKELRDKFGLDPKYQIRLIVNSAIRDQHYNSRLSNASKNSSHQTGYAIDFSDKSVDVIDLEKNTFVYFDRDDKGANTKHDITYIAIKALSNVLADLHEDGEIFAIIERGHYHVTDKGGIK